MILDAAVILDALMTVRMPRDIASQQPDGHRYNESLWSRWGERAARRYGPLGIAYAWALGYGIAVGDDPDTIGDEAWEQASRRLLAEMMRDIDYHRTKHPADRRSVIELLAQMWAERQELPAEAVPAYVRDVCGEWESRQPVLGYPRGATDA